MLTMYIKMFGRKIAADLEKIKNSSWPCRILKVFIILHFSFKYGIFLSLQYFMKNVFSWMLGKIKKTENFYKIIIFNQYCNIGYELIIEKYIYL